MLSLRRVQFHRHAYRHCRQHLAPLELAAKRRLSKAPITEALIDLRAVPAKGFDANQLKSVSQLVKDRYPRSEERKAAEALLALTAGKPPTASTRDLGFQGMWLRSQDEKEVAQFRVDGFTYSRLNPYSSWEDILPKALELWETYADIVRPESVTRIAVRYINHLPLPDGSVELDDLILTGPRLPQGVPDMLGQFSSRVLLAHPDKKLHAIVTQSLEVGVRGPRQTLLLDIDAFRLADDFPISRSELEPLFSDLREYKNLIFFGSLTDSFAKEFE